MRHIKEKKERALGTKLFLKAERCSSPKCVMVRRPYRPGLHGQRRVTVTDYGRQLQEKQKIQLSFGLNNRQMRILFRRPADERIPALLERLDHVVFLLGLARSSRIARQFISHGHIAVNGRTVTIPSYRVSIGDTVAVRAESRGRKVFEDIAERLKQYEPPPWLKLSREELRGECVASSTTAGAPFPFDIHLVGQFFSR